MKMSLPQSASLTAIFNLLVVADACIGHNNRCVKYTVPWLVYKNRPINPDYFCMILTKCVTFLFQNLQSLQKWYSIHE